MKMKSLFLRFIVLVCLLCGSVFFSGVAEARHNPRPKVVKPHRMPPGPRVVDRGYRIDRGRIIATGSRPVIIDFYADWCGPCRQYRPVFESVKRKYGNRAIFISIDTDRNKDVSRYYNIRSIPTTMLVFPRSDRYTYFEGVTDQFGLESFINRNMR